ncbi:hypothetical protein HPP92_003280 [Vanilla planifolia]|uniref:Uncharacterized protein n=1 Tax=Vanilla planifolia TaxID=51239 RepID=A0A835SGC4_VANPL|nr:hypothetical protein HPP92_003280 [Vanilla planifolia]
MIPRTPLQRKRRVESVTEGDVPVMDHRLVPYEKPFDEMVCSYQCRQMVKSEFILALNTAEKKVLEYQARLEAQSNHLCRSEEERKRLQDRLCSVEQELQASKGREHALQEQLLKEINEYQERYHAQLKRCSELEVNLKKEESLHKHAELAIETAKHKASDVEEELRMVSQMNERENKRLQKALSQVQDECKFSLSRANAELERMTIRADNAEKDGELLKKNLADLQDKLTECLNAKDQLEHTLSSSDFQSVRSNTSEDQTLVKYLKEELQNYESEVQEARRLKSSHVNLELLKEQLLEEKSQREKAQMELSKLKEIQLHAESLEFELTSWKSLLNDIPDVSSYDDIRRKFSQLQKEIIEYMLKVGESSTRLKELEVTLEMANVGKELVEKECKLANEKIEYTALEVRRLEVMLSSASEECEKLKRDAVNWRKQKTELSGTETLNEKVVKELESSLEQREHAIREMEDSLNHQKEIINRQHSEVKMLNERLNIETRKVKALERESDQLRSEISLLESKLGHGDYSAANTKVLRMVNTLGVDNEAKHVIEALQAELQKTQAKLQAIEELKGQAGNVMHDDIPEKLSQLKGQIAVLEKREDRYKAVFAEKISVFRRACCSLFG